MDLETEIWKDDRNLAKFHKGSQITVKNKE
jgi:hypothetical protein